MKCKAQAPEYERDESLPVRGAWVEMLDAAENEGENAMSLPVRGAWVEIADCEW